jgi:peptidoglycan-associated lipoprotein
MSQEKIDMRRNMVLMAALLSLAACSTSNKPDTSAASETQQSPTGVEAKSATARVNAEQAQLEQLSKVAVYFDFDKSKVKSEFQDGIKQQADFMLAYKNDKVTLEGNCDERGSAEYNLALGERRAYSVERELKVLGVPGDRIKTVSNGKEKPHLTCHEEKCWKENRRVDFMHTLE